MGNFLYLLWILAGAFSAYYMVKQQLKQDGQITAKGAAVVAGYFFGGIVSAVLIIANDGDSITFYKPEDKSVLPGVQPMPTQQTQTQTQPVQTATPAYQSVGQSNKGGSVLDG